MNAIQTFNIYTALYAEHGDSLPDPATDDELIDLCNDDLRDAIDWFNQELDTNERAAFISWYNTSVGCLSDDDLISLHSIRDQVHVDQCGFCRTYAVQDSGIQEWGNFQGVNRLQIGEYSEGHFVGASPETTLRCTDCG